MPHLKEAYSELETINSRTSNKKRTQSQYVSYVVAVSKNNWFLEVAGKWNKGNDWCSTPSELC